VLPKQNRLKKKKDFERVLKEGKGFKEDFLFLKILKNNLEFSRFGFIVSQKVSKKATVRNKIKRRLREIVRLRLKRIKRGIDGVLIALWGLENKSFKEMEETINKIFKRAKIYD
jgi:ribonuclease P protein component